jgi:hypothetical protein
MAWLVFWGIVILVIGAGSIRAYIELKQEKEIKLSRQEFEDKKRQRADQERLNKKLRIQKLASNLLSDSNFFYTKYHIGEHLLEPSKVRPRRSKRDIIDDLTTTLDGRRILLERYWNADDTIYIGHSFVGVCLNSKYKKSSYYKTLSKRHVLELYTFMEHFNAKNIDDLLADEYKGHSLEFWLHLQELFRNDDYWLATAINVRHFANGFPYISTYCSSKGKDYIECLRYYWKDK